MRFDSLNIPGFGPFSDFSLDLPAGDHDVHLIYGPNEAGKSSLLRAIRYLIFGIPARTSDNFRHANPKLLIGASISQDGESLTFFRKKGNKNTLLDGGQNTLPEAALAPFLGQVNEDFFRNMFWLDAESLREGARALLAGEGDLGTALFSASLGGSPVDEAIRRLESEAESLCKGTSKKNTTILPAVAAFKEAEKEARRELISSSEWRSLEEEIEQGETALGEADRRLREHRLRGQFVESCQRALPILQAIRELEAELKTIDLPDLPSDFPERVRSAQKKLARSEEAYQLQKNRIESAEESLAAIPDRSAVLAAATDFELLARRAEQHLSHLEVLPRLEESLTETDPDRLPEVTPEDLSRVRDESSALLEAGRREDELKRSLSRLEIEIETQRRGLTGTRDLTRLEDDCRRVEEFAIEHAGLPALQERLGEVSAEGRSLEKRLEVEGRAAELQVPGEETIRKAVEELDVREGRIRELEQGLRDKRDGLAEEEAALEHLASQAPLYTRRDLLEARRDRDRLWAEIRRSGEPDEQLGDAMVRCDEIADTLREEADRLAAAAGHQARLTKLQSEKKNLEADLADARRDLEGWQQSWEPGSRGKRPLELLAWRQDWEKLCQLQAESRRLDEKVTRLQERERDLLAEFEGNDFDRLHRSLKEALREANQEQGERRNMEKQLSRNELKRDQLKAERADLLEELAQRREQWNETCRELGLPGEISPASAVETLNEQIRARERLEDYQRRRVAVDDYEKRLRDLAERFEVEPAEASLSALYEQARLDHDRARVLRQQLEGWQESFPEVRLSYENDRGRWQELVDQGGSDDLDAVIMAVEKREALRTRLAERLEAMRSLAGSRPPGEFMAELEEQDPEVLAAEKLALDQEGDEIQRTRDEARTQLDDHLRRRREMMAASDASAAHRQTASEALATIVHDTERFRRLHYAMAFLRKQVEAYREKTQGPMLAGTSAFFETLTRGAFSGVSAQYDDRDQPQLVALRPGGEAVPTSGLSEGTADQLYLALRLAAMDLHLQNHPPIPLVLDDLLMTFDDDRTRAVLPVLAEISRKTQVLVFTHHEHLLDLVDEQVTVHRIPVPKS